MVENIGQAYEEASPAIKRNYLSMFFESFTVEGEKIVDFKLKEDIEGLMIEEGSVLLKSHWGGRPDSNRRLPLPQRGALPLNYGHHNKLSPITLKL